jgi:hypothetical protein
MGIDFCYNLYFYREDTWVALQAAAQLAPPGRFGAEQVTVLLPDGTSLVFPWKPKYTTDPVSYTQDTQMLQFDTAFWLKVDENERPMFITNGLRIVENGYVIFGSLDLTIDFKTDEQQRFVQLGFHAVSDGMSLLMEESRSLHRLFGELLAQNRGSCGILDREDYQEAILFWLKGQAMFELLPEGIVQPLDKDAVLPIGGYDVWLARRFDHLVEQWISS